MKSLKFISTKIINVFKILYAFLFNQHIKRKKVTLYLNYCKILEIDFSLYSER